MNVQKTLSDLHEAGYKVTVRHGRIQSWQLPLLSQRAPGAEPLMVGAVTHPLHAMRGAGYTPCAKGGKTVVSIFDKADNLVTTGAAFCNPVDPFNKKIGLEIALGRALHKLKGDSLFDAFSLSAN